MSCCGPADRTLQPAYAGAALPIGRARPQNPKAKLMPGPLGLLVLFRFRPFVAVDWSPGSAWLPFATARAQNFYSLQASVQGRILVLQAQGSQLSLVAQKEVKEAVWTVQAFQVSSLTCTKMP